jgi:uncharacterized protein (DUF885 family)
MYNFKTVIILISFFTILGCDESQPSEVIEQVDLVEIEKLNTWLDEVFERNLMDSPIQLSQLGRKDRQGEFDDLSEAHALSNLELAKNDLALLLKFDESKLDEQSHLSYILFKQKLEMRIDYDKYRHYNYPVKQIGGQQSRLPSFMINKHLIEDKQDALDYINRLNAFTKRFDELIKSLQIRENKEIIPPSFVFPQVINDCENIVGNTTNLDENLFVKDFIFKLEGIELVVEEKDQMIEDAKLAVTNSVNPSYQKLIEYLKGLEKKSSTDDGVWKLNDGENFYKYRLKKITTTSLTGSEIFDTGIAEVARIHTEMQAIMKTVDFDGTLQAFFTFMKEDSQFYFPDSDQGRVDLLQGYQSIVDTMEAHLDEVFFTKPKGKMQVLAVEKWREKSAGKAFYQTGSPDGSQKGTFFANLYKMEDMPKYEMEALAYHEGIPGHHMQFTIAQELTGLPEFRKHNGYTANGEGWGLYCEFLPKEMGFYTDPYSDFGRLAMELWRACRLVVDVGIHQKKWSREKAIQYLQENTPNSENSCTKAIERYIVMPGQATAYKVGMIHILKMRTKAKEALGQKFDIRKFHDVFLTSGPVPLDVFEQRIDKWIENKK